MNTADDFENFYAEHLLPHMDRLKAECKASDKWLIACIGSFLAVAAFLIFGYELFPVNMFPAGATFIAGIVCVVKYSKRNDTYVYDFKQTLMNEISDHLNPGMRYKPDNFIPEKEFQLSSLYRYIYNDFDGEDLIEGTYNNITFHCSEVYTDYGSRNSFRCLFLTAAISKSYNGGTYVWDKDFEQLPASIYDEEYRMNPMPDVVRVRTPDTLFNKYYSVCSTNPSQSAQILTATRLHNMAALRANLDTPLAFSFVAGRCFIMAGIKQDYMEPGSYYPEDKELAAKYYDTVRTILHLMDVLNVQELC